MFLVDGNKQYSYVQLLEDISKNEILYPYYTTESLYHHFLNFLSILVRNEDITLLDSDFSASEVESLGIKDLNCGVASQCIKVDSVGRLRELILSSTSKINIFTSGTTGQPKKVTHTVSTLTRASRYGEKYAGQVWGYAYNPTHMAGLQVFFQAVLNGNTMINLFGAQRADVIERLRKYDVTHISATPTFYRLLRPADFCVDTVRRITLGGEKSDTRLISDMQTIFPNAKVNNIYASTEAGSLFAAKGEYFAIPEGIKDYIKVIDDEILIHRSLLGSSESLKFDGDYYHTGDLIEWKDEAQTLFRFKSRKNELLNVGGYKVNPADVEDVINNIDGVKQVMVYGKKNSVLGTILCADIQLAEDAVLEEPKIREILKSQLQDYKIPRKIKFVEEISTTRTGKIKRNK